MKSRSIRVVLAEEGAIGSRAYVTDRFWFTRWTRTEVFVCIKNGNGINSAEWVSESTGEPANFLGLGAEINRAAQAAVNLLNLKTQGEALRANAASITTLEDAIEALERLPASKEVSIVHDFLQRLKTKVVPVDIPSDEEGFIIEGAMQWGFDHIDDDASALVVSAQALIDYTKRQRGPA